MTILVFQMFSLSFTCPNVTVTVTGSVVVTKLQIILPLPGNVGENSWPLVRATSILSM